MLCIHYCARERSWPGLVATWCVNEPIPEVESQDVQSIHADGQELEYIYALIPRLKRPNIVGKVVKWETSGAVARAIFLLMKLL